ALSGVVPWGSASGEIRSTGAPHGDFTVPVAECYNDGEAWSSDVWIITRLERTWGGKTGFRGGLELVEDGAGGWRAILENPNSCDGFDCPKRAVEPRHCPVCDVRSEARGWWWRRRGHARIDCSFPPGGTLKVERAFPGCAIVMPMGGDPWPHALVDPGERYSRDGDGRRRAQRPPVVRSRIQSRRSPRSASRRSPGARPTFSRRSPRGSVR
ncbi:MAG TPA: hypothetical protein PLU22_26425, partial [Polyangiaceae bacterium]|nr:hypothetical protein [Polyangiaceae bacterium]